MRGGKSLVPGWKWPTSGWPVTAYWGLVPLIGFNGNSSICMASEECVG